MKAFEGRIRPLGRRLHTLGLYILYWEKGRNFCLMWLVAPSLHIFTVLAVYKTVHVKRA
ncbi:hypothetical protein SK128_026605 [Halocaridina rubra]|uniref:Uncharacterized protein n=1 Tax=Halocaridina rubra TaxID=373956 RepID=A0AAN8XDJ1_HALRR